MQRMQKVWKMLNGLHDIFLIAVFAAMVLLAVYSLWDSAWILSDASDASLRNYKPGEAETASVSPITDEQIGWLTVEGTNIDYPLMQGEDNYVFLNRDPYGNYSMSGSIFLDSRCNPDFSDGYSLIYGHHIEFGRMFGALDDFLDEKYLRAHSRGTLYLGRDGARRLQLEFIAAMRADARDRIFFDPDNGAKAAGQIVSRADVLIAEPEGRLVALTTCADTSSEDRLLVFAKIIGS
ncbi:MAG: class B sortase [Clostridia bacterium]|nr:class B sortase [Clostridia bacterium]